MQAQKVNRSFGFSIGVGDAAKDIIAAPGEGKRIVLVSLIVQIVTSAAQAFDLADTSNTVKAAQFAASSPVGTYKLEWPHVGRRLTVNEAFRYLPAAAGNALFVTGEYYIEGNL